MVTLTLNQIEELLQIIEYHFLFSISINFGPSLLNKEDLSNLDAFGFDSKKLFLNTSNYDKMYLLGRLTSSLSDSQIHTLNYEDILKYVKTGQYIPLTSSEKSQLEIARRQTYVHLKGLKEKAKGEFESTLLNNQKLSKQEYEQAIKEGIEEGVIKRKSVSSIISELGHKTNRWDHDWGRIVETEMQNVFQMGRAEEMKKQEDGGDPDVYKSVFPGACRHCIRLYTTNGIGSQPKVFKLSQLEANGTNVGRKVAEWKATLSAIHPHCFINAKTKIFTSNGWKDIINIKVGDEVLTHNNRFRKVTKLLHHPYNSTEDKIFNIHLKSNKRIDKVLKGITGTHPILTERGWIRVENLNSSDKVAISNRSCLECGLQIPLLYDFLPENTVEKRFCSISCSSFYLNRRIWTEEKRKKHGEDSSIRVKKIYQENPDIVERIRETHRQRYLEMSLEERKLLTKNANKKVRELIKEGNFNFSESFLDRRKRRRIGTRLENRIEWMLKKMNLNYKSQYRVILDEKTLTGRNKCYYLDFYLTDYNLGIECDGKYFHEDIESDLKRDLDIKNRIMAEVIHFSEDEIDKDLGSCFKKLERVLENHDKDYSTSFIGIERIEVREGSQLNSYFRVNKNRLLYNFSVEEDESYIANGFAVHNCRCHLYRLPKGYVWDQEKGQFDIPKQYEKIERKSKIKIKVGDKEFDV